MTPSGGLWPLLTVLGPVLIIIAIIWSISRNRKASQGELDRTERATHANYKEQDAQDKSGGDGDSAT